MSQLKAAIAVQVSEDIGSKLEDAFERAKLEISRLEGQRAGAAACMDRVNHLLNVVSKELDEGKLDEEQSLLIKPWLVRAHVACDGVLKQSENDIFAAQGQVRFAEQAVGLVKKVRDGHAAKLAAKVEEPPAGGASDGHPGPSLKALRQAEASGEPDANDP